MSVSEEPSAQRSWTVGDVRITKVPQMTWHIPLWGLVPEATEAACHEVAPGWVGDDAAVEVSLHGLVVESGDRRILVDTCAGHDEASQSILGLVASVGTIDHTHHTVRDAVEAAGWSADDIDTVVCTHLHFDHVGGNLVDGVAAFPNARYLIAGDEWGYWSAYETDDHDYAGIEASVRPLVEAGAVDLVDGDHALTDSVRLLPTPGHTPGHVSVAIDSGGEAAVITGDLVHHPIELLAPHWTMSADVDGAQCSATRRSFVEQYGDGDTLLFGTHFGGSSAGRFDASAGTWTAG
jgi:glyoxylase-like metal-dependent hydrolase (beta-lactamase superfamily II)